LKSNREARTQALREVIREMSRARSLRAVAADLGVSHATLHQMIEGGTTPYDSTLTQMERRIAELRRRAAGENRALLLVADLERDDFRSIGGEPVLADKLTWTYGKAFRQGLEPDELHTLDLIRDELIRTYGYGYTGKVVIAGAALDPGHPGASDGA
jgi:hypothetical protein